MMALLLARVPTEMRGQVRVALRGEDDGEEETEGEVGECRVM